MSPGPKSQLPKNNTSGKDIVMKHGARNQLTGKVKSIKLGDVMSLIKFDVTTPSEMASVITTESVNDLDLKVGDQVQLIVKAIHVLPVKM
jgi:molybdopterin-binding protein